MESFNVGVGLDSMHIFFTQKFQQKKRKKKLLLVNYKLAILFSKFK